MALGADMKTEWRMVTLKDCVVINESTYSPKEAWAHDRAGTYTRCVILCYRKLVSGAVQVTGTPCRVGSQGSLPLVVLHLG